MRARRFDSFGHYFVDKVFDVLEDSVEVISRSLFRYNEILKDPRVVLQTCFILFLLTLGYLFQDELLAVIDVFLNQFGAPFYYAGILRRKLSGFSRHWKYRDMPELERHPDVQEDALQMPISPRTMNVPPAEPPAPAQKIEIVKDEPEAIVTMKKKPKRKKAKAKRPETIGERAALKLSKLEDPKEKDLELDTKGTLLDYRFVRRRNSIDTGYGTYIPSLGLFRPPKPDNWLVYDPMYGVVAHEELQRHKGSKMSSDRAQVC